MKRITIICVKKRRKDFYEPLFAEYEKRLKGYCKLEIISISPSPLPENPSDAQIQSALEKEGELILKKIPASSRVYPLCIEGRQLSSEALAGELEKSSLGGFSSEVFIIGGSYGLPEKVKQVGQLRLSMSKMTFPHRLATVMLLEQLYRAFSINASAKYHK